MQTADEWEYVGFWWRNVAYSIDALLITAVMVGFGYLVYGADYFTIPEAGEPLVRGPADLLLTYVLPPALIIAFWIWRGATPGKMAIGARIVCASDGSPPGAGRCIGRYLGYFVSTIPLGLGFPVDRLRRPQAGLARQARGDRGCPPPPPPGAGPEHRSLIRAPALPA